MTDTPKSKRPWIEPSIESLEIGGTMMQPNRGSDGGYPMAGGGVYVDCTLS